MHWINIFIFVLLFQSILIAQSSGVSENKNSARGYLNNDYHWTVELPLWVPGYSYDYNYGADDSDEEDGSDPEIPTQPIEKPEVGNVFSRLFSSDNYLKYFWGLKVVYKRDRLLAQVDVKAGVMGNDVKYNLKDIKIADADLSMSFTRAFLGYAIIDNMSKSQNSRFSLYGCLGLYFSRIELASPIGGSMVDLGIDYDWTPVILGIQGQFALSNWLFVLHGDFGLPLWNSSYSLAFEGFCHYRLSKIFSIKLGWIDRYVFQDIEVFNENFVADIHLSGPVMGVLFHF